MDAQRGGGFRFRVEQPLLLNGICRVIAHDRRSHGRSDQTWDGNDMDTYADDLAALIDIELDEAHWAPLRFMRDDQAKTGVTPTLRRMQAVGGFDIKQLYQLFPASPARRWPGWPARARRSWSPAPAPWPAFR